jgi:hypothetical protein
MRLVLGGDLVDPADRCDGLDGDLEFELGDRVLRLLDFGIIWSGWGQFDNLPGIIDLASPRAPFRPATSQ